MSVEKRLKVLSFVPEPTRRNIQHLKDYPVFKVFFFSTFERSLFHDPLDTPALKGLRTATQEHAACGIETSKARVPRYEPEKARVP